MKAVLATCLLTVALLSPVGARLTVGESALCKNLALQTGQELRLALAANPTTGYRWQCAWTPRRHLTMARDEYVAAPAEGRVGGGGTQHYTLVARAPGHCRVDLRYAQPWAGGEADIPRSLHLIITAASSAAAPPPVEVAEADCVPNTVVSRNGYLAVMLPENPTTGFSWRAWWDPEEALRLLSDRHVAPRGPAIPGRGGTHRWVWKAVAPGSVALHFQYRRPWPGGEEETPRLLVVQVGP